MRKVFEDYKTRRREANKALRAYRKGAIIWNNGTYIKAVHGKIGYGAVSHPT